MPPKMQNTRESITDILPPRLLQHIHHIVFPWPTDAKLNGTDVGRLFFLHPALSLLWNKSDIKQSLINLADIGTDDIDLDDLVSTVISFDINKWKLLLGAVLLLDQAPCYLCKGTDARYTYHLYDLLALCLINNLIHTHPEWLTIAGWQVTGLSDDHVVLRILMLLAPLVHSEDLADQHMHLQLTEDLRTESERRTKALDPYRASFLEDLKDVGLIDRLLTQGPPQGSHVRVFDFVYWLMRYYTSHVSYVVHFGRSPFRNIAVGRDDASEETQWLRLNGVFWREEDENVRRKIKADIQAHAWTPMQLKAAH